MTILIIIPIISFLFDFILVFLNKKHLIKHKDENTLFEAKEYIETLNYGKHKSNAKIVHVLFRQLYIIALIIFLAGFINDLSVYIFANVYLSNLFTVFLMYTGLQIIATMYEGYDTFTIEAKYDFNRTTKSKFLKDQLLDYVVTALILAFFTYVIMYLYNNFDLGFIVGGFLFVSLLLVLYNFLFIVLLMPLMYKMTPIENDELTNKIKKLAQNEGFTIDDIVIINASERTTKINAYFSGFGKRKKVMLFDTLFDKFTDNQLMAIIAHEIGHSKHKHMLKDLIIDIIVSFIYFILFYLISISGYQLGTINSFIVNILIFIIIVEFLTKLIKGIKNYISRYHEKQADLYVKSQGYGEDLIFCLTQATILNKGNLNPHPLFVFFKYDHPSYYHRIDYIK